MARVVAACGSPCQRGRERKAHAGGVRGWRIHCHLCGFSHYACPIDVNCWTIPAFSCQEAVFRVYILSVFMCFHTHSRIDLRFNIFMCRSPVSDREVTPTFRACPEQGECVGTSLACEFVTCPTVRRFAKRQS